MESRGYIRQQLLPSVRGEQHHFLPRSNEAAGRFVCARSRAVLPVLGAALTLSRLFTHGFARSEDSVIYISQTRNLLQGADCASGDGAAYDNVVFAPGYSWVAGAGQLRTGDPLAVAGPLNAALHGAVIRWLQHRIAARVLVGGAGASSRLPRPSLP